MDSTVNVRSENSDVDRVSECHNVSLTSSDEDSNFLEDMRVEEFRSQVVAANGHGLPVSACSNISVQASPNTHIGNKIYMAPVTIVNAPGEDETYNGRAVVTCGSRRSRITLGTGWCLLAIVVATYVIFKLTADKQGFHKDIEPVVSERGWFITREGWLAHPPNTILTNTNEEYRPLKMVIIAHTVSALCTSFVKCAASMRSLQDFAMNQKGYGDISYNFAVGRDGRVYEGRGWHIQGAHTKGYNDISIGIAFIGDYRLIIHPDMRITPEQIARTQKLLQQGVSEGYLSHDYVIKPHCELKPTLSPGDIVYREMVKWPHYSNTNSSYKCEWARY